MDVPEIDIAALAPLHEQGGLVFDVREPDEYADGHLRGATLVPMATVPDRLAEFPTSGPVYIICAAGGRSRTACNYLRTNGVDAINVAGGTLAWIGAGNHVVTGTERG